MKPTTFNITPFDGLATWRKGHEAGSTAESRLIRHCVLNDRQIYIEYEKLCAMCRKQYARHGGLDLGYLTDSSMLKSITRAARRRVDGGASMDADKQARYELAGDILESCWSYNIETVGISKAINTRI